MKNIAIFYYNILLKRKVMQNRINSNRLALIEPLKCTNNSTKLNWIILILIKFVTGWHAR